MHDKLLSMGTGVFLLIFSIAVVMFDASNFLQHFPVRSKTV